MNDKWNFEMDEKTLNIYRNLSNQIVMELNRTLLSGPIFVFFWPKAAR